MVVGGFLHVMLEFVAMLLMSFFEEFYRGLSVSRLIPHDRRFQVLGSYVDRNIIAIRDGINSR